MRRFIGWLGSAASKFHDPAARYGSAHAHNAVLPRDRWLEPWEKAAIPESHAGHRLEGYQRRAFMMLEADVVEGTPEADVETISQRACVQFPGVRPGIISDSRPQFVARDFKDFIRICGMTQHGRSLLWGSSFLWESRRPATIAFASAPTQGLIGPMIVPLGWRPPPGLVPGMTVGPSSEPLGMGPPPGFVPGSAMPSSGAFIEPLRIGPPPGFVPGRAVPPSVLYPLVEDEFPPNAAGLCIAMALPDGFVAAGATARPWCTCTAWCTWG
jgi:hypothetical protein